MPSDALDLPTEDFTAQPALDEKSAVATMAFGMEAISGGTDLLILGEMGIGNTTAAAAIYAALYGGGGARWAGRGTGVNDDALARKILVIDTALALHGPWLSDPLEVLRRLGGREIAAICGAIIAARLQRIPVVLDGYAVTAAAAILHALDPASIDHCVAGHLSAEGAHREVLVRLNKVPLLALDMRLGEATGGALAASIIKAAVVTHNNMATFEQAQVSRGQV
jgi:nicotinate-nucleotide--dimethylbenzimidazole phosphoribosyltransferase